MHIHGVNPSGSLLHAALQQQANTNVLSKVHNAQRAQGKSAVTSISANGDEAERTADGDERGGGFQVIA